MAEPAELATIGEPIKASMLVALEGDSRQAASSRTSPVAHPNGILLKGLDRRFGSVWAGGHVVGVGLWDEVDGAMTGKKSLPLYVLATALLNSIDAAPDRDPLPNIYIIAPHTYQTIPMLHAHLANTISNSHAAVELLKPVRLLQYFDLAGIVESVAEVNENVYRNSQNHAGRHQTGAGVTGQVHNIVLIQGIGPTVYATYRRSNLLQANALLAGLGRNITQLSRLSSDILVMVEFLVDIEEADDRQQNQGAIRPRTARSMVLDSAFSGSMGETLRLASCHETLSKTLDASLDRVVVVHDGLGRITSSMSRKGPQDQVVEVIKDRSGNLAGLWDVWKEA
ncbi:hypothetical protein PV04_02060 [Phialophora macrospora]|uniref:Uncharacterized protein n=1 Tax=Phialophora macrospora TaxID=1851006 RepID=A0A0D2EI23_9EURO|nr:hypothetical protein PV04_02060 [Phialophora macrospora]